MKITRKQLQLIFCIMVALLCLAPLPKLFNMAQELQRDEANTRYWKYDTWMGMIHSDIGVDVSEELRQHLSTDFNYIMRIFAAPRLVDANRHNLQLEETAPDDIDKALIQEALSYGQQQGHERADVYQMLRDYTFYRSPIAWQFYGKNNSDKLIHSIPSIPVLAYDEERRILYLYMRKNVENLPEQQARPLNESFTWSDTICSYAYPFYPIILALGVAVILGILGIARVLPVYACSLICFPYIYFTGPPLAHDALNGLYYFFGTIYTVVGCIVVAELYRVYLILSSRPKPKDSSETGRITKS